MNAVASLSSRAVDAVLALVYPQPCAVCGDSVESRQDGVACAKCWDATRIFTASDILCWKCGALSFGSIAEGKPTEVRCRRCDDEAFTVARACGLYEGALRASILELKRQPHVARRLAKLLRGTLQLEPLNTAEVIVPVPLHPLREAERGFNQARVLAHELEKISGLPLDDVSVVRHAHTERHRAGMDAKARRQSVAKAFEVRKSESLVGRRVLLVDDVLTTGATVSACAKAIMNAGAEAVLVVSVGRVGRNSP